MSVYVAGHTKAMEYALDRLGRRGCQFTPQADSTVTHLLLPVPAFTPEGTIKGGGRLEDILPRLPENITVIGGNLDHPALEGYRKFDLLKDPAYLAENANITAYCALSLAMERLPVTLRRCPVLIIGWGRIGKCLARLCRRLEAQVTVTARRETDRAAARSLDYIAIAPEEMVPASYRLIFNTAPEPVLENVAPDTLKIDLASRRGMAGDDVIWARGLPGVHAPETSGKLIAYTIIYSSIGKELIP